jgi:flagellar basal body-associated protein FliL
VSEEDRFVIIVLVAVVLFTVACYAAAFSFISRRPPPRYPSEPRALSHDEERERIIAQGEAFCRRFPTDRVCHPPKEGQ